MNNTIVIKDFSHISDDFMTAPTDIKKLMVENEINTSRYSVLGAVNQYGKMKLKCRFHNVRDRKGRWTCKRK